MPTDAPAPLPRTEAARRIFRNVTASILPVLFIGFFLANTETEMSFLAVVVAAGERLLMLGLAAAVVAAAGLFGMRVLRLGRVAPEGLFARFVLGVGVGLGTLSLATLGLGCAGLVGPGPSALTLGVMFLVGLGELRPVGDFLRGRPPMDPLSAFELLLIFIFLLVLLFQLSLAFNLPLDYDACEYHMAAPARWFQLGRIDRIPGNVYSNLPMNCEMLYLFSMGLVGKLMLGIHLAVVMNALTAVLASAGVYVLARRFLSRRDALAAMTLFFTTPWVIVASTVNLYNEMLLAFYATLAVYAFLDLAGTRRMRQAALAGVFAGLAAGVKYTALAFFPPVLGVSVIVAAGGGLRRRLGAGLLCVAVMGAAASPWFVKNLVFTGNPTYPFFHSVFGGRDWSAELDAKWIAGQKQAAGTARYKDIVRAMWAEVLAHKYGSLATAVFLVLGLGALRERPVRWLAAFVALWTLMWYVFTHRVGRFWLPMTPCAVVLAARGFSLFRSRWASRALAAVLVGALSWQAFVDTVVWSGNVAGNYDLRTGNGEFLARRRGRGFWRLVGFARTLEPTQRMMLVGEAQTLYLPPNVSCSTVFDREIFTSTVGDVTDADAVREGLRRAGVTHLFVNWAEVGRLRETYTWTDADGRTHPGFPPLSPRDFERLVRAGVLAEREDLRWGTPLTGVRGLSADDLTALPGGKVCVVYEVH